MRKCSAALSRSGNHPPLCGSATIHTRTQHTHTCTHSVFFCHQNMSVCVPCVKVCVGRSLTHPNHKATTQRLSSDVNAAHTTPTRTNAHVGVRNRAHTRLGEGVHHSTRCTHNRHTSVRWMRRERVHRTTHVHPSLGHPSPSTVPRACPGPLHTPSTPTHAPYTRGGTHHAPTRRRQHALYGACVTDRKANEEFAHTQVTRRDRRRTGPTLDQGKVCRCPRCPRMTWCGSNTAREAGAQVSKI